MSSQEEIVKRLENVTARLEAICAQKPALAPKPTALGSSAASAPSGAAQANKIPTDIQSYDAAIGELIESWAQLSDKIGGDVVTAKGKVLKIFEQFRNFLWFAAGTTKPSDDEIGKMIGKIGESMQEVAAFKDSKRNTPQFNHLSAMAETLGAFSWVMSKTPAPVIKDFIEAAMFFGNRIMKEFKETDPKQVEWFNLWKSIFEEMQKFVRQTHTTGLVWNSSPGCEPPSTTTAAPAPPKGPGGPPPPPPPPIPADLFANMPPAPANNDKSNRDALFAALNKGEAITSGLKKVTADMQTHKNPSLRGTAPTPQTVSKTAAGSSPAKPAQAVRKPPNKTLEEGKTWVVENFVNDQNIVIDVTDKKQCIYVFRCENSVIKVNGKANSITLDSCKKTSIVFQALVAQCETINCQSVQIQTLGELPTLSIQKTDGCQVYLSKEAQGCEIVTSKSSEMNILVQTTDDGEYSEFPVPEQFKTTFVNGKLVTVVSDIV